MASRSFQGRLTHAVNVIASYTKDNVRTNEKGAEQTTKMVSAAMRAIATISIRDDANALDRQRANDILMALALTDHHAINLMLMSSLIRVEEREQGAKTPEERRALEHRGVLPLRMEFLELFSIITD